MIVISSPLINTSLTVILSEDIGPRSLSTTPRNYTLLVVFPSLSSLSILSLCLVQSKQSSWTGFCTNKRFIIVYYVF